MFGLALQLWIWLQPSAPPTPTLAYDAYVTRGADPDEALPTVVILHGRDDALHGLPAALRYSSRRLRVVVPWGPRVQRDGTHAWFRRSEARSRMSDGTEVVGAASMVVGLLTDLQASGLVSGRPVLVGYSQGASVALEVSVAAPDSVSEVIAISGHFAPTRVPTELGEHAVTRVLVGERDTVMSAAVTLGQVRRMQALGYLVEAERFPGQGHGIGPKMRRTALRRIHAALRAQAGA
ncbi:MAG: alpha/beta hydrolase [Nannocystaceae bacterium]|nr:hypothetical protein [bacterium]